MQAKLEAGEGAEDSHEVADVALHGPVAESKTAGNGFVLVASGEELDKPLLACIELRSAVAAAGVRVAKWHRTGPDGLEKGDERVKEGGRMNDDRACDIARLVEGGEGHAIVGDE